MALTEGLEIVPRRTVEYRGLAVRGDGHRRGPARGGPQVAVVDEFPHTNVPGSTRAKRWEDVHALLDAGIDVLTTMNVQHLESLNDQIWQSTGVRVRETIPDWVVRQADEVVMVDLAPRALLNRLERGVVYPPERARAALRELLQGADAGGAARTGDAPDGVHRRRPAEQPSEPVSPAAAPAAAPGRRRAGRCSSSSRIPHSAALIRRGRRVADYLQGGLPSRVYVDADRRSAASRRGRPRSRSSACSASREGSMSKPASSRARTSRTRSWRSHGRRR